MCRPVDPVFLKTGACVALTLFLADCEDVANDPQAMAVASETHGAVLLTEGTPTVSDVITDYGLAAQEQQGLDAWWESWELGPQEGPRVRSSLYAAASHAIFPYLLEEGVADLLARNEESLKAAQAVELLLVADAVDEAMERAWNFHNQAVEALGRGMGRIRRKN